MSGFSASPAQRKKVRGRECVVCGRAATDPMHLAARAKGGCDHPDCVVPGCRTCHRLFDENRLDLLPHLVGRYVTELKHALAHYRGDLVGLTKRLTLTGFVKAHEEVTW